MVALAGLYNTLKRGASGSDVSTSSSTVDNGVDHPQSLTRQLLVSFLSPRPRSTPLSRWEISAVYDAIIVYRKVEGR